MTTRRLDDFAAQLKRLVRFAAIATLACSIAIPANRYGLRVVPDAATYERLTRRDPDKRLVDLETLGIPLDIRYATANNFMKEPLYPAAKAYLRAPAARALADVQASSRRAASASRSSTPTARTA